MIGRLAASLAVCLGIGAAAAHAAEAPISSAALQLATPQQVIAAAARKVVKVYGAGGLRGLEGYQTGILITPDGQILTAASTVLDTDAVDCVLDDGRRYSARLVGIDPRRELALLQVDADDLPAFVLDPAAALARPGTRVIALSNMFGVAAGDERVTAQRGVVAAVVPLEARRGAAEATFQGQVYVLDCTTNNPGSPGGALVDSEGRLLGILGKELRSTAAGVWLSYALPVPEIAAARDVMAGGPIAPLDNTAQPFDLRLLGAVLVPDLLERTPPFVESVEPGSAADRSGLISDDLVVAVGPVSITTRAGLERQVGRLAPGDPIKLAIIRAGRIVEVELGPRPPDSQATSGALTP
jgi:S1-C subfamily serine protease